MKFFNIRFITGLVIAGILFCNTDVHSQCATPISTFPYLADFETSQDGWASGGTNNDWAWGTPAKPNINHAGSGLKCWITGGLDSVFYNYSELSYVESPCFNFTNLQHPFISLLIFEETEHKYDGANLQYTINNGTSWFNVGGYQDTSCLEGFWYNYPGITWLKAPLVLDSTGWNGNSLPGSTEGHTACQGGFGFAGWVNARHCMQNLAGQPSVIFRITFGAGTTCNHFDGFAFDSVAIGEAIANTGTLTYNCTSSTTVAFTGTAGLPCSDTYAWNFGDPNSGASNTAAVAAPSHTFSAPGSYTVTLIISGGPCNAPDTLTQAIHILDLVATPQAVSCFNGDNGAVNLTATDGVAPYTYSWTGGITTQNLANVTAGTYTVTVTAAQSCSATASAIVTQPAAFTATATPTGAGCGGNGSATANPTGGTAPLTYHWSGGSTPNAQVDGGLTGGTYTVTITDAKGCTATASCVVTQSAAITASATSTNTTCGASTGSVTLTVSNGTTPYTYVWSNAATTQNLTNVAGNTYTVTITDAAGCTATASAFVAQTGAPTLTATAVQITCNNANNGQVNTTVTGGTPNYTYSWSTGPTTPDITNLAAGTYTVTVKDAQGCSVTASEVIVNPAAIVVTLTPQNETCFGNSNGSITSAVTGGTPTYSYVWSNLATTPNLSSLSMGTYSVVVTDQNSCTGTAQTTVSQPNQLTASASAAGAGCFGQSTGTITLTVNGGTNPDTYLWSNSATTQNLSGVTAGSTYSVIVTDANSCTATASATITSSSQIFIGGTSTNALCFGYTDGTVTATENGGAGGFTYLWSNNATTQNLTGVVNGSYTLTVTDASGCTADSTFIVGAPAAITVTDNPTEVSCFGGSNGAVTITAAGGAGSPYNYAWSNGSTTTTISNLVAAAYTVTVTDANACTQSATYTITQPANVTLTASATPQSCPSKLDGSATADVAPGGTPPFSYTWSNQGNTATISNLAAGTYKVTVTDAHNCPYTASAIVTVPLSILATDTTVPPVCPPLADGSITVINVTGGTPPYTYSWNGHPGSANISNLKPGTYILVITDANGCATLPDSISLQYQYNITVTTGPGSTIQLGSSTEVTSTSNVTSGVSYTWNPLEGLECSTCQNSVAQPVRTGWYYVAVQDSNGCTANDSVLITVIPDYDLFIPNAFTPNGDGNNDYFEMFGNKAAIIFWEIRVFNRWGEKVFESHDVNFGWDGTYKGKLQDPGVFVYEGKATFLDDHTTRVLKGSVTLIR